MKPTKEQIEDQWIDALLHEQARQNNSGLLESVEHAIDQSTTNIVVKQGQPWRQVLGLAAAAAVIVGAAIVMNKPDPHKRSIAHEKVTIPQENTEVFDANLIINPHVPALEKEAEVASSPAMLIEPPAELLDETMSDSSLDDLAAMSMADSPQLEPESLATADYSGDGDGLLAGRGIGTGIGRGKGSGGGYGRARDASDYDKVSDYAFKKADATKAAPAPAVQPPSSNFFREPRQRHEKFDTQANGERYDSTVDPEWQRPADQALSTFSIDVDNASYSNIRRFLRDGQAIPRDAVRIEECINAFDYNYAAPANDDAFAVHHTLATCPWNPEHVLLKIGIKGREIPAQNRPASNLVFLIDVSGSMQDSRKLPLVVESLTVLIGQLDERDRVSYVVYAGSEGVVLPPTRMDEAGRGKALEALKKLQAGGSTNGGAGIKRAYQLAQENFIKDGVNRVILASDGDFNVGITGQKQLVELVKERAAKNIYLSILAFGTGNTNDAMMEAVSKEGNGNYYYIDSIREGRKVFLQKLSGTLVTIAKDVKIQVEFNPARVGSYRLIGYADRVLKNEDFNNDKVDAGDIGAGHTVTAFYEIVPAGKTQPGVGGVDPLKYQKPAKTEEHVVVDAAADEWLTLKLRHKHPEGDISKLIETVVKGEPVSWKDSGADFQFAAAVAMFGMKLRSTEEVRNTTWSQVADFARPGLKNDATESRAEFMEMLKLLEQRQPE